ncbi:hypothetical protein CDAR_118561 [Caerostris darwini]|uniref:Uncharacterized protein n=1 Tax=Caerostris darwini TaxID=1538125 RepID=A0AAV4WXM6_9ARAC|nr:hypothetical protein CDAR_118561 [Caerostris darwini]
MDYSDMSKTRESLGLVAEPSILRLQRLNAKSSDPSLESHSGQTISSKSGVMYVSDFSNPCLNSSIQVILDSALCFNADGCGCFPYSV